MNEPGSEVPEGTGWGVFHKLERVNPSWPSCPAPVPRLSRLPPLYPAPAGTVGIASFPPAGRPASQALRAPPCQPSFSPHAPAAWRPSPFSVQSPSCKRAILPGSSGSLGLRGPASHGSGPHPVNGVCHFHGHNTFLGAYPALLGAFYCDEHISKNSVLGLWDTPLPLSGHVALKGLLRVPEPHFPHVRKRRDKLGSLSYPFYL